MTDIALVLNESNSSPDTVESFYDSPSTGRGTKIKAFTATNDSAGGSVYYKAYIYDSSGALVQAIIPQTIVVLDRSHVGYSAIGHIIPAGGSLRMESSTADGLNFNVAGIEQ